MILFRTERPQLLERELETHQWYEQERPWERFGLVHLVDREPGDWRHYSEAFRHTWNLARATGQGFINSESDVVPTLHAFEQLLECEHPVCMVPYELYGYNDGVRIGNSATIETRVRGGWESHFAVPPDEWACGGDLGFVRFSADVTTLDIHDVPPLAADNGLLNELLYRWLQEQLHRHSFLHLHWPALVNHHVFWDSGDNAHHPPDQWRAVPGGGLITK